jgi:hypothetical protein
MLARREMFNVPDTIPVLPELLRRIEAAARSANNRKICPAVVESSRAGTVETIRPRMSNLIQGGMGKWKRSQQYYMTGRK